MSARQQFHFPATSPESSIVDLCPLSRKSITYDYSGTPESTASHISSRSHHSQINHWPRRSHLLYVQARWSSGRHRSKALPARCCSYERPHASGGPQTLTLSRSFSFTQGQFPVVAPTPQAPRSSPFLSRDTNSMHNGFKVPSMREPPSIARDSGESNAHISTLDVSLAMKKSDMPDSNSTDNGFDPLPNLKFNPVPSKIGARRVSVNKDSGNFNDVDDDSGMHIPPGHEITEDGRVKAINGLKRMHNEVDDDGDATSYEPPMKRYRNNQYELTNANLRVHTRDYSHTAERPSSRLLHSDQYRTNGSASGDAPHSSGQHQRFSRFPSSPHKSTPSPYHPQPIQRRQEPAALTKLLGHDPDLFVQEHMS